MEVVSALSSLMHPKLYPIDPSVGIFVERRLVMKNTLDKVVFFNGTKNCSFWLHLESFDLERTLK
jgi:hypothetical protein